MTSSMIMTTGPTHKGIDMRSVQFDTEEHLENLSFPILIRYTDTGEQWWADDSQDIDETRCFVVVETSVNNLEQLGYA